MRGFFLTERERQREKKREKKTRKDILKSKIKTLQLTCLFKTGL